MKRRRNLLATKSDHQSTRLSTAKAEQQWFKWVSDGGLSLSCLQTLRIHLGTFCMQSRVSITELWPIPN